MPAELKTRSTDSPVVSTGVDRPAPARGGFAVLANSLFIQLSILLSICIAAGAYTLPNMLKDIRAQLIDVGESYKKVPQFLASSNNPDVVLMGSSLMLAPAMHCDAAFIRKESSAKLQEENASYPDALYFEGMLNDAFGKHFRVFNFALPGCMMSDANLLLQEMKTADKTPRLVVLGIAPRDCMNNQQAVPEETVLSEELKRFKEQHGKPKVEAQTFANPMDALKKSVEESRKDLVLIRQLATTQLVSMKEGGDAGLLAGKDKQTEEQVESLIARPTKKTIERSVSLYKRHYNPPSMPLASMYLGHYERMLEFAKANKVPLVVVSMPITELNKSLLAPEIYSFYQNRSKELAAKYGIPYVDIDKSTIYAPDDYRDTVHLNAAGGKKFYTELIAALKSDAAIKEMFK